MKVTRLPDDHFRVFKNITDYRTVDFDVCYRRLGLFEEKKIHGKIKKIYKFSRKMQPKQLCVDMQEFREKIAGKSALYKSIIERNPYIDPNTDMIRWGKAISIEKRGIPQGSPMSDVLANLYLMEFDSKVKEFIDSLGGVYRRYSDDILLIIPCDISKAFEIINVIKAAIAVEGKFIKISDGKTIITEFFSSEGAVKYTSYNFNMEVISKQFEYLGFSYDGNNIFIKSQTLTRYFKRMIKGVRSAVFDAKIEAKSAGLSELKDFLNESEIFHKFSNVNRNRKDKKGNKARNFMSYAVRASQVMKSQTIKNQLRRHRKKIRETIDIEVLKNKT